MAHLSYTQFKGVYGSLGLTAWVKYNFMGVKPSATPKIIGKWNYTTANANMFSSLGFTDYTRKYELPNILSKLYDLQTNVEQNHNGVTYQSNAMRYTRVNTRGKYIPSFTIGTKASSGTSLTASTIYGYKTSVGAAYIKVTQDLVNTLEELGLLGMFYDSLIATHTKQA